MCTVLLPPGDNPIALDKYININTSSNWRHGDGDDYKIEGISNMNLMKRKTRNNQNKRDVLNETFVLSSQICFLRTQIFQLNLSCLIIKQLYSGQAKNKHGWQKFQYSVWCPKLPTMDSFTPLIKQTENANSKKIKIRIYKFWSGSNRAFVGRGFLPSIGGREYL